MAVETGRGNSPEGNQMLRQSVSCCMLQDVVEEFSAEPAATLTSDSKQHSCHSTLTWLTFFILAVILEPCNSSTFLKLLSENIFSECFFFFLLPY